MFGLLLLIFVLSLSLAWLLCGGLYYIGRFNHKKKQKNCFDWEVDQQDKEQIL
jgi:uncharacterized membrane protein YciS (DUF1049 family)